MSKYRVNSIKPSSPMKKYEFLREQGVIIATDDRDGPGPILKGAALDKYIEESMWRIKHPGQEPIREGELKDGLPTQ